MEINIPGTVYTDLHLALERGQAAGLQPSFRAVHRRAGLGPGSSASPLSL